MDDISGQKTTSQRELTWFGRAVFIAIGVVLVCILVPVASVLEDLKMIFWDAPKGVLSRMLWKDTIGVKRDRFDY